MCIYRVCVLIDSLFALLNVCVYLLTFVCIIADFYVLYPIDVYYTTFNFIAFIVNA